MEIGDWRICYSSLSSLFPSQLDVFLFFFLVFSPFFSLVTTYWDGVCWLRLCVCALRWRKCACLLWFVLGRFVSLVRKAGWIAR